MTWGHSWPEPLFQSLPGTSRKIKQGWEHKDVLQKIGAQQGDPSRQDLPALAIPIELKCHFLLMVPFQAQFPLEKIMWWGSVRFSIPAPIQLHLGFSQLVQCDQPGYTSVIMLSHYDVRLYPPPTPQKTVCQNKPVIPQVSSFPVFDHSDKKSNKVTNIGESGGALNPSSYSSNI